MFKNRRRRVQVANAPEPGKSTELPKPPPRPVTRVVVEAVPVVAAAVPAEGEPR